MLCHRHRNSSGRSSHRCIACRTGVDPRGRRRFHPRKSGFRRKVCRNRRSFLHRSAGQHSCRCRPLGPSRTSRRRNGRPRCSDRRCRTHRSSADHCAGWRNRRRIAIRAGCSRPCTRRGRTHSRCRKSCRKFRSCSDPSTARHNRCHRRSPRPGRSRRRSCRAGPHRRADRRRRNFEDRSRGWNTLRHMRRGSLRRSRRRRCRAGPRRKPCHTTRS